MQHLYRATGQASSVRSGLAKKRCSTVPLSCHGPSPVSQKWFGRKEVQYPYRSTGQAPSVRNGLAKKRCSTSIVARVKLCQSETVWSKSVTIPLSCHGLSPGSQKWLGQKEVQCLYRSCHGSSSVIQKRFGQKEEQYLYRSTGQAQSVRHGLAKKRCSTSIVPRVKPRQSEMVGPRRGAVPLS